jgi:SAM-dependent methyltransferase
VFFEFGCGLGRVTSHIHKYFGRVIACDISPSHLVIARNALRQRDIRNVELRQAIGGDFGMIERFDLWFSRLVLQHNTPPLIALILKRALSLIKPGGIAMFQVPTGAPGYQFKVEEYMRGLGPTESFEMHALPQQVIFQIAKRAGCRILEQREDGSSGPPWASFSFVLRKERPLLGRVGQRVRSALLPRADHSTPRAGP